MKNRLNRYNSLRIVVCSVWSSFGDVGPECLRLSDIELLLVAFDSQLKIGDFLLNQEKQPVFNITQIKSWEVIFLKRVTAMILFVENTSCLENLLLAYP
ncbi:hypothetical protein Tco_0115482 [Tanacetum coccineum]